MKNRQITRFLFAWLLGGITSYFMTAFMAHLYMHAYQTLFFAAISIFLIGIAYYLIIPHIEEFMKGGQWILDWPFLFAAIILIRFTYKIIETSLSFPRLFYANLFILDQNLFPFYLITSIVAGFGMLAVIKRILSNIVWNDFSNSNFIVFLRGNLRGFLLAGLFFSIYFVIALVFNRQEINTNNILFAADTHSWRLRLTHPNGYIFGTRVVHPFPFLLLRPLVAICSIFFAGDWFFAAVFLLSLTGSAGLFLAWIFIRTQAKNRTFAFLFAALLGISTTYLLFNSLMESYIFSAFFLVTFYLLLRMERSNFLSIVLSGVMLFGITISNVIQSMLAVFLRGFDIKRSIKYTFAVLAICFILSFVNKFIYPESGLFFFDPSEYTGESRYSINIVDMNKFTRRARLVSNEMFLFSVVAPKPFLNTTVRGDRGEFPKFNFFLGPRVSRFEGFGKIAVWIWISIFIISVIMFGRQLWVEKYSTSNQLATAFLCCLGFNFTFHLFYGYEPFLYAANWTYALVLFAAVSLRPFAKSMLMQAALLFLIGLLTLNNLSFLYFLMDGLAPYIPVS